MSTTPTPNMIDMVGVVPAVDNYDQLAADLLLGAVAALPDDADHTQMLVTMVAGLLADHAADIKALVNECQSMNSQIAEAHATTSKWIDECGKRTEARKAAEAAEAKLSTIRAMATRGVPNCINLDAIDRVLNEGVAKGKEWRYA